MDSITILLNSGGTIQTRLFKWEISKICLILAEFVAPLNIMKRQGQVVAAMLNNFSAAEKSLNSMANSEGNAMQEMETIYQSVEYHLNKLKETGTGIAQNLFQSDDMKTFIDLLTKLAEALDFVTDKAGLLGTIGLGAGLFAGIQNVGINMLVAY